CKCRYIALDLAGIAHIDRGHLHAERRRHGLDRGELAEPSGDCGITNDGHSLYARGNLLEYFRPFRSHAVFVTREPGGIAAWPRQGCDVDGSDLIGNDNEYNRHNAGHLQQRPHSRAAIREDDLRRKRNHFRCLFEGGCNACTKTDVELNIATFDPTQFLQALNEHRNAVLCHLIVGIQRDEHTNAPHALALLRPRRERPGCDRTAEKRYELAASDHSITSSARASTIGGISRPIAFAVLTLITNVNLVGRSIGKSAALAPLRMRSTYVAARLYMSGRLGP